MDMEVQMLKKDENIHMAIVYGHTKHKEHPTQETDTNPGEQLKLWVMQWFRKQGEDTQLRTSWRSSFWQRGKFGKIFDNVQPSLQTNSITRDNILSWPDSFPALVP